MSDGYAAFGEMLQSAIYEMKIPLFLSDEQKNYFYVFYKDLIEKNKVMNLTSITEKKDVILKHFADSVALALAVPNLSGQKMKVIDLGTGAGFPGIPVKIVFPELEMVLADSLNKRILFLQELIDECRFEKMGRSFCFIKRS